MCHHILLELAHFCPPSQEEADKIQCFWKWISSASSWLGRTSLSKIWRQLVCDRMSFRRCFCRKFRPKTLSVSAEIILPRPPNLQIRQNQVVSAESSIFGRKLQFLPNILLSADIIWKFWKVIGRFVVKYLFRNWKIWQKLQNIWQKLQNIRQKLSFSAEIAWFGRNYLLRQNIRFRFGFGDFFLPNFGFGRNSKSSFGRTLVHA